MSNDNAITTPTTYSNPKWVDILHKAFTWLFRLIAGGTFIFSGFVKAIDPWGTIYKFGEYFEAMGISMLPSLTLTGVFGLCAIEFLVGIFLVLGIYRKSAPLLALAFMCVMLPLTLWIAVADPVSDCGCFGDFLLISNWSTFWKNVILTAIIIWLIKFNRDCTYLISPAFQWLAVLFSAAFILIISFVGYTDQPLLDFRPYTAGTELVIAGDDDNTADDADNLVFVYEKDGQNREFGVDDELPDESDGWKFVERRQKQNDAKLADPTHSGNKTFRIWNLNGDTDVTEEVMLTENKTLVLMIPELKNVSPATTWRINALYDWADSHSVDMIAVVSGNAYEIMEWKDMSMPEYPIYTSDDTAIKEVVRGNPGVVMTDNNKIQWKTSLGAIDVEKFIRQSPDQGYGGYISDAKGFLHGTVYLYLIFMAIPVALSFMPSIYSLFTRDGKAHDEE